LWLIYFDSHKDIDCTTFCCADVVCGFAVVFQSVVCGVLCDAMFSFKDGSRI
jgi:hypothetical protein